MSPSLPPQVSVYDAAIRRQLARLKDNATRDDYLESARLIFGWAPPQLKVEAAISRFWEVTDPIMEWGSENESHQAAASHLLGVFSTLYGRRLPFGAHEKEVFNQTLARCLRLSRIMPQHGKGGQALYRITSTERLLSSCIEWERAVKDIGNLPKTSWGNPEEFRERAEALAPLLAEHRMYGVKSSFTQDGVFHRPEHAWVYLDGADEIGKLSSKYRTGMEAPLAIIHLTSRGELHDLEIKVDNIGVEGELLILTSPYTRLMGLAMRPDGTLAVDPLYGIWSYEEAFKEAGRTEDYPAFWLSHLLRVSDLIVPEMVREEDNVPKWPVLPSNWKGRKQHAKELPDRFLKLYLPRRRILEDPARVRRALEQETHENSDRTKSTRASHGHTWFWRRLPEGYQASPQMRALALEERGMEPPEGHTYVKARGKTPGHEIKRRSTGM